MDTSRSFGDIPLADYQRVIGLRRRRWPRLARIGLVIAACAVCTAAGDYTGLWTGKNSRSLAFADGMYLLRHPAAEDFHLEGGMAAVSREMRRALNEVAHVAHRSDGTGRQARGYLLNLAMLTVKLLEDAPNSPEELARIDRNLPRRSAPPK